jgi:hypothetical protein
MSASASAQAISNGNGASRARPSAIARALARTDRNPQSTSTTAKPWRKRPPRALSHSRRAIHINTGLRTNPLPTRGTTAARKSPLSLGFLWSGQQDSNLRPAVPKTAALPGCAIPRGTSENSTPRRRSEDRKRSPRSIPTACPRDTLDRRARPLSMQSYRRSRSSARWIHVSTAVSKADDRDG